ncbi:MAG: tRNA dihydrouridine synthase DusB [Limnochordaceae bacterium]|nr:tRNA dihydrouridine synthase DusB [Limnochordaceae bacterium]
MPKWRLGPLEIENQVVLAPMAGATHSAFRRIARQCGAGLVCSELISAQALHYKNPHSSSYLHVDPSEHPVSLQLFGSEAGILAEAARQAVAAGADVIDLNLGCPVPKVVGGGDGCRLMLDPPLVGRLVEALVRAAAPQPVTVKMRKGWDVQHANAVEVARVAQESGAAAVTVHGRLREQHHQGPVDLGVIAAVQQALRIPVIGNGGIRTPGDALQMLEQTGCTAVMVGQAALGNPWLLGQIAAVLDGRQPPAPPTPVQRVAMARRHLQLACADEGEAVVRSLRGPLAWYIRDLPRAAQVRDAINRLERAREVEALLAGYEDWLAEQAPAGAGASAG